MRQSTHTWSEMPCLVFAPLRSAQEGSFCSLGTHSQQAFASAMMHFDCAKICQSSKGPFSDEGDFLIHKCLFLFTKKSKLWYKWALKSNWLQKRDGERARTRARTRARARENVRDFEERCALCSFHSFHKRHDYRTYVKACVAVYFCVLRLRTRNMNKNLYIHTRKISLMKWKFIGAASQQQRQQPWQQIEKKRRHEQKNNDNWGWYDIRQMNMSWNFLDYKNIQMIKRNITIFWLWNAHTRTLNETRSFVAAAASVAVVVVRMFEILLHSFSVHQIPNAVPKQFVIWRRQKKTEATTKIKQQQ